MKTQFISEADILEFLNIRPKDPRIEEGAPSDDDKNNAADDAYDRWQDEQYDKAS